MYLSSNLAKYGQPPDRLYSPSKSCLGRCFCSSINISQTISSRSALTKGDRVMGDNWANLAERGASDIVGKRTIVESNLIGKSEFSTNALIKPTIAFCSRLDDSWMIESSSSTHITTVLSGPD